MKLDIFRAELFQGFRNLQPGGVVALHCEFHLNKKSWSNLSNSSANSSTVNYMFMYVLTPNDSSKCLPFGGSEKTPFLLSFSWRFLHWAKVSVSRWWNSQLVAPNRILPINMDHQGWWTTHFVESEVPPINSRKFHDSTWNNMFFKGLKSMIFD